ncbi:hypothetical protein JANAI62_33000 [Jannaschia pagri]|uniref:Activator of Hsp90 ATPase homolog 1-like protein n=1 Tax=Jannaschia pagri TaxID=2829797 RepID=A0ABQ4NQL8_9RHOB|nr:MULTISPECIES: SRPBCC family protein [unclassified Jannaschia]GIT92842.1 hypothetical protein JANAI61_33000 [Jannaschia sp. AI_61]GIT96677.1 hypothetical protein JANAI62_33000 [Jannaschia sp. AI_62]
MPDTDPKTLVFSRLLPASPQRTYDALIDPAARQIWGPPDADSVVLIDGDQPVVEGGRETSRCGPKDNPYVTVLTDWIILAPGSRLTYAETLVAEGAPLGVTLATADLEPDANGTRLTLTLQIVSYVGSEMLAEFEGGWTHAITNLEVYVSEGQTG